MKRFSFVACPLGKHPSRIRPQLSIQYSSVVKAGTMHRGNKITSRPGVVTCGIAPVVPGASSILIQSYLGPRERAEPNAHFAQRPRYPFRQCSARRECRHGCKWFGLPPVTSLTTSLAITTPRSRCQAPATPLPRDANERIRHLRERKVPSARNAVSERVRQPPVNPASRKTSSIGDPASPPAQRRGSIARRLRDRSRKAPRFLTAWL